MFMARIAPFRAWRYNPEKVPDLAQVISPPYDVIDRREQQELHMRHPCNVIRLELGEELAGDDDRENRYTRAARFLRQWQRQEVLVRDPRPALYLYHHRFQGLNGDRLTRRGLVALLHLEPLDAGVVFPHEQTFPKHKKDRLALLRACRAQFNPIFSLFPDPRGDVMALLEPPRPEPELRVLDDNGVDHLIWSLHEPRLIRAVVGAMEDRPVFIADGHHRYETCLRFQMEQGQEWNPKLPFNWTLMYLAPMEDPGLIIFPTHKLVKNLANFDSHSFLMDLSQDFQLEEISFSPNGESHARRGLMLRMKQLRQHGCAIGMALPGKAAYWILRPRDMCSSTGSLAHLPECLRRLDVTILHELILKGRLGIDVGGQGHSHLVFSHDLEEALELASDRRIQAAFFMNPIPVSALKEVAAAGCKMPQKATYFYPKLLSGLLIRTMEEEDRVPNDPSST